MTLTLALSVAVMLAGLIALLIQRRFNEILGSMFLGGLVAALISFGGSAVLHLG